MREADAAEALVLDDGRDAALNPEAQVTGRGRAVGTARVLRHTARELGHKRPQAREDEAEAVVLRRDLHAVREQVHDRLVAAAVTELELLHRGTAGKADHLMAQADTKDGHPADELLHLRVGLGNGIRVAGAVGEKDAVGRAAAPRPW